VFERQRDRKTSEKLGRGSPQKPPKEQGAVPGLLLMPKRGLKAKRKRGGRPGGPNVDAFHFRSDEAWNGLRPKKLVEGGKQKKLHRRVQVRDRGAQGG